MNINIKQTCIDKNSAHTHKSNSVQGTDYIVIQISYFLWQK